MSFFTKTKKQEESAQFSTAEPSGLPPETAVSDGETRTSFYVIAVDDQGLEISDFTDSNADEQDVKAKWGEIKEIKHSDDYLHLLFRLPNGFQYAFDIDDEYYFAFIKKMPPYVAKALDGAFIEELFASLKRCGVCGYKSVLDSGYGESCLNCYESPWKPYYKGSYGNKHEYYLQKQQEYRKKIEEVALDIGEEPRKYASYQVPFEKDLNFEEIARG